MSCTSVFLYIGSFDAQGDLPEIGKEVLIYKGESRNRNARRISHLLLSPEFLILFIDGLGAFRVTNNLIQVNPLLFLRLGILFLTWSDLTGFLKPFKLYPTIGMGRERVRKSLASLCIWGNLEIHFSFWSHFIFVFPRGGFKFIKRMWKEWRLVRW